MRVLVIGGRGFVGDAVCRQIRFRNHDVFTFDRKPGEGNHIQGSINSKTDLTKGIESKDVVVNLVGLSPIRKPKIPYHKVHVDGVRNIIKVCKKFKVKKIVHMSALKADKNSDIEYLRTKGLGEELLMKSGLKVNIICPSIIFDRGSEFVKMISRTAFTLGFPNIRAKVQPIFRGDVGKLFALAVEGKIKEKKLEIGGPDVITIFEMAKKICNKKGYICLPVPLFVVKIGMFTSSIFGWFGISKDQIRSLYIDNVTKFNDRSKYLTLTNFDDWLKKVKL